MRLVMQLRKSTLRLSLSELLFAWPWRRAGSSGLFEFKLWCARVQSARASLSQIRLYCRHEVAVQGWD